MRHYKIVKDGYVVGIGTGLGGVEIAQEEYENILAIIENKPAAETGFDFRLCEDLTWELVEVPVVDPVDEEATEADYLEALAELGVEV